MWCPAFSKILCYQKDFPCLAAQPCCLLLAGICVLVTTGFGSDADTLFRVQVLGSDYKSELLAVIPEENLPVIFGGKSPCEMVDVGPWQVSLLSLSPSTCCGTFQLAEACVGCKCDAGTSASVSPGILQRVCRLPRPCITFVNVGIGLVVASFLFHLFCALLMLQDPTIVNNDPVLVKAAAGGQLGIIPAGLSRESDSFKHNSSSSSLIGTTVQITADSSTGSN